MKRRRIQGNQNSDQVLSKIKSQIEDYKSYKLDYTQSKLSLKN